MGQHARRQKLQRKCKEASGGRQSWAFHFICRRETEIGPKAVAGVVITLCLVKEVEAAPGDLDAEAHHLVDEAKNLVSVAFDISKMNP